ncbi:MAG: hypothetical protein RL468_653 [Pseudomonadota bacterium]|jgi:hypothetical protein
MAPINELSLDERFLTETQKERIKTQPTSPDEFAKLAAQVTATAFTSPEVTSASVIQDLQQQADINALVDVLRHQTAKVRGGDMERPKAILMAQAHALDSLFLTLTKRAMSNARDGKYLDAADRYLRLALKAQGQAVRTLEVLNELVNPRPVAYFKQANIAQNQQINHPPAGEGQKTEIQTINEASHELHQNTSTPRIKSGIDSPVATLAVLNRAKVGAG